MWPFKRKKVLFTIEVVEDTSARVSYARFVGHKEGSKHSVVIAKDAAKSGIMAVVAHELGHLLGHVYLTKRHLQYDMFPLKTLSMLYDVEEEAWDHARKIFEASRETALLTYMKPALQEKFDALLKYKP